jgi:hypothetical protein
LFNETEGNSIYFLDTEGSASLTRDSTNDAKIFTLANLISSYLIYNTMSTIDEKSISELNVVTQLSRNIILEEHSDLASNEDNLYKYMPKFMYLIRDFSLELPFKGGRRMTPNEYFEDSLHDQNAAVRVDESTRRVRRALLKYYKDRQCMVLVRPADEETDLQKLDKLPEHKLRRDFI